MSGFILGKKGEMEQMFDEKGRRIPVTYIHTRGCYLVDIKTPKVDGYFSVVLGFLVVRKIKKPQQGKIKKAGIKTPLRFFREIRFDAKSKEVNDVILTDETKSKGIKVGDKIYRIGDELKSSELFSKGDKVNVVAKSKGKGFQGVMKRHGFAGGPATHGQSDRARAPGSIGASATPSRVLKGKKMAGRMGGIRTTIQNLKILGATEDRMVIKGLIPGSKGGLVIVYSLNVSNQGQHT